MTAHVYHDHAVRPRCSECNALLLEEQSCGHLACERCGITIDFAERGGMIDNGRVTCGFCVRDGAGVCAREQQT